MISQGNTLSLWKVIQSQQRQIDDIQRKLDEVLNRAVRPELPRVVPTMTPSSSDSVESLSPTNLGMNYKAQRRDVKNTSSLSREWDSMRRSRLKALPPPSLGDSDNETEDSEAALMSRRVELLIQKYTSQ